MTIRTTIAALALAALLAVASWPVAATVTSWYASPTGAGTACAIDAPCPLAFAIGVTGPALPGDTVYLKAGNYLGFFHADVSGASGNPITISSAPGEWASIDSGLFPGTNNYAMMLNGTDLVLRDVEITNSDPHRTLTSTGSNPPDARNQGVGTYGARAKIINCVIHDTGQGIGQWSNAPDSESYGNLVYWVGWTAPDRTHGHLIYIQSTAPGTQKIRENVMFESFDIGYHAYGSSAAALANIYAEGNVIFASGAAGGANTFNYLQGGGVPTVNSSWVSNFGYSPLSQGFEVFGYVSGCSGTSTITGNYFFGAVMRIDAPCTPTTMSGNTFIGNIQGFTQAQFPSNTYLPYPAVPTDTEVFVRPNAYETGRANVVVYNWSHAASVAVDLFSVLSVGDQYEIRYARNYFGTPVLSGIYSGGTVDLPMTGYAAGSPVGFAAPDTTLPEFGAYVVRKVAGASLSPTPTPVSPTATTTSAPSIATPTPTWTPAPPTATAPPTPTPTRVPPGHAKKTPTH